MVDCETDYDHEMVDCETDNDDEMVDCEMVDVHDFDTSEMRW